MAVYERSYRPYVGELTAAWSRFLVIPRYAYQEIFSKKLFVSLFVACFVWPLICAVMIYLPHNVSFLKAIGQQIGQGGAQVFDFDFNANFFMYAYMGPQGFWSLFLAFVIGPQLISADLRNNAMPLYLSRPFSRKDYVLGKISVLIVLLSSITWIPGILLYLLQGYLTGDGWLLDNVRIGASVFVGSWVWIMVLGLVSLALSAYVKWKPMARMGLFGVFFIGSALGNILNVLLETYWASVIDIGNMFRVVLSRMFGVEGFSQVPTWAAWASIIAFCSMCIALLARRVRAYEVVR
jgi:ABC-2 type transport system permease protein